MATRRFTWLIRINVTTICNGWLRRESTQRPPSRAANSSFGPTPKPTFGMAVSIRIGCWQAFEQLASGNAKGGFPLSRIVCHMDWAAEDRSHIDDLIEFESRVNDVWRRHDDAVICIYHLAKFGGDTVIDIMRTHPMIIIGGILQQNPFFVPPEEFLPEIRERRARRTASSADGGLTWKWNHQQSPAEEIKRLQRCINDLVSVLALPAIWSGGHPTQIVRTLLDALLAYAPPGSCLCAVGRSDRRRANRDGPDRSIAKTDDPAARNRRDAQPLAGR